jgi:hypothetical protein
MVSMSAMETFISSTIFLPTSASLPCKNGCDGLFS